MTDNYETTNIVLAITGSIAAYKSAELVRLLRNQGYAVRVLMTESATKLIAPLTFQALTERPVVCGLWESDDANGMPHIELARWADLLLVAPATAQTLAKLAYGFADDLLQTTVLATQAPVAIAPAMNTNMWRHPATQQNVKQVTTYGYELLGPCEGEQACGDTGVGSMLAPEVILQYLPALCHKKDLTGYRVLVTAGPTHEPIDPVRYIGNRSSGKMGYALAERAAKRGAIVTLVTGPTSIAPPAGVEVIHADTAWNMFEAVKSRLERCDGLIMAAAVSDYTVKPYTSKMKKHNSRLNLALKPSPDILQYASGQSPRPYIVGFAAETQDLEQAVLDKLAAKGADMMVGNIVGYNRVFGDDDNEVVVADKGDQVCRHWSRMPKRVVADCILDRVAAHVVDYDEV